MPTLSDPVWSGYTCFAAIAQCVPDDIATVGYKVFLGSRKYFVSVDVGGGRIQWCASPHNPPPWLHPPAPLGRTLAPTVPPAPGTGTGTPR